MLEAESYKSYWEEFYKSHPDPAEFRDIFREDSILTKIFNFSPIF